MRQPLRNCNTILWKINPTKLRLSHLALSLFLLWKVTSKQINCLALFDSAIIVKWLWLSNNGYRYFIKKEDIQWQNLFEYCFIIKYLPIENAEQFAADHLAFCKSIGLKGRILVADEGINGTVSGDYETTQKYMDYVHSLPGMEDLWFKIDEESEQAFKKMFVRYKKGNRSPWFRGW